MQLTRGNFKEYGARTSGNTVTFTYCVNCGVKKAAIILYDIKTRKQLKKIELTEEFAFGRVHSVSVSDIDISGICYLIEEDGKLLLDPYCTSVAFRDDWADFENRAERSFEVCSGIDDLSQPWDDVKVDIAPADMIIYKLHMRGFTAGSSLAVSKQNYKGIITKIPYFKELGVTSLEFMPLYDFEELFLEKKQQISPKGKCSEITEYTGKTNYWGYTDAAYFAPKASYFGGRENACSNFRTLVSTLHKNGLEMIMEMSFSPEKNDDLIIDCLKYYVKEFHVDGFHILGCNAPIERIAGCPFLADTKIFYEYIPETILALEKGRKHLFNYNDDYMNVTRQIQNHMNGSMVQFANHMRRQNDSYGFVNYMANVCGFSLFDSYSYGEKHNQSNGEDNRDGTNNNFSFNYGCEGKTNNKGITNVRFLQMRNAFAALLLAQSVPLIVAGDEVAATHEGNNNPYCQDNKTGYTVFSKTKHKKLLQDFVIKLIQFRKAHKCIHPENAFVMADTKHLGLPDMSFHGSEPWAMLIGEEQKALGVLYNGAYADEDQEVYVCYNFHYDEVDMALPLLAPGKRWRQIFNTSQYNEECDFTPLPIHDQQSVKVPGGSISLLVGVRP